MLRNPYNPLGIQWSENHLVQGRVSQEDFYFLKRKFPYYPGLVDKIISNLFKAVIDELRKRDRETHIETALYIDDPSYKLLDDIIARITSMERRSVGGDSVGETALASDESRRTDGLHPTVQRPAEQRTDKKGRIKTRKRSAKSTAEKEK